MKLKNVIIKLTLLSILSISLLALAIYSQNWRLLNGNYDYLITDEESEEIIHQKTIKFLKNNKVELHDDDKKGFGSYSKKGKTIIIKADNEDPKKEHKFIIKNGNLIYKGTGSETDHKDVTYYAPNGMFVFEYVAFAVSLVPISFCLIDNYELLFKRKEKSSN